MVTLEMIKKVFVAAVVMFITIAIIDGSIANELGNNGDPRLSIADLTSNWDTQEGNKVTLSSLKGHPTVIAMIYTGCPDMCPLTISKIQAIENNIDVKLREKARFALFSFDSENDTPSRLKSYANLMNLNLNNWTLFHGDDRAVRELAAALSMRYRHNQNGFYDHSTVISLIDSQGAIVKQLTSLNENTEEFQVSLNALLNNSK